MQYVVLLGLSLFFGFAFEEFYGDRLPNRPGGVRTFPLLSFAGAGLYLIEPHFALAFVAGLLVLGGWTFNYVRFALEQTQEHPDGYFVIPSCIILAYLLGGVALTQPLWLTVAIAVGAVLLIGSRTKLHELATRVPFGEVLTLAQFLLLVGVVLPLLQGQPEIAFTHITPFKVWLAVVAVSTLSYVSYLLQRYVFAGSGVLLAGILGGLYSSTATTVVLARRARDEGVTSQIRAGIVAATAMMYVRIVIVCAIFNLPLARAVAPALLALGAVSLIAAFIVARFDKKPEPSHDVPGNPLQLGTAIVFAALMIVISFASSWVQAALGSAGMLALAAVVGITDIDPFVLTLAQGGAATVGLATAAAAVIVASSSNNVLKAIYTLSFSRRRESWMPMGVLLATSALGLLAAWFVAR
ncbi:MAG TPA: DUF4010 domain-containing protein [Candidatus Baltobacteraceae bacterium]|nr:DUF4010 domain-containing protein [Candidatus Baltobacteraceae bacterium]